MNDKQAKILFVDDEESILMISAEYFKRRGYQVTTAKNGLEAVEILKNEKIDCCFTDINMPEMDGLELAANIRKIDNTIPVIIMTGYPSMDNSIKTLKNGVVDFLIKPVALSNMEVSLKRVLRERQIFVENIILKKEFEDLRILNTIMSRFSVSGSSFDLFKRTVDITIEITTADEAEFYLINETTEKPFKVASCINNKKIIDKANNVKIPEQLIMETASDKTPLLISKNDGICGLSKNVLSVMLAPLTIREKVFGVLTASIQDGDIRFTEKDLYYLSFISNKAAYAIENLALYENIYENLLSTLYALVKTVEVRDPYTQQHSNRVTVMSSMIGKEMECKAEDISAINVAGRLHDIGKIGIRDNVLMKPGRLTNGEYDIIKTHSTIGADIVGQLGLWRKQQQIVKHHHERFDGKGYPDGLKNEAIPLLARIVSVADAYDAMASDRSYRKKMDQQKILKIINDEAGAQFDPAIVKVFMRLYKQGRICGRKTPK